MGPTTARLNTPLTPLSKPLFFLVELVLDKCFRARGHGGQGRSFGRHGGSGGFRSGRHMSGGDGSAPPSDGVAGRSFDDLDLE